MLWRWNEGEMVRLLLVLGEEGRQRKADWLCRRNEEGVCVGYLFWGEEGRQRWNEREMFRLLLVLREEGRELDLRCTEPEGQSATAAAAAVTVMARARTWERKRLGRSGEEVEATYHLLHHHGKVFRSPVLLLSFLPPAHTHRGIGRARE